jgi:pilus assembly protein FimV
VFAPEKEQPTPVAVPSAGDSRAAGEISRPQEPRSAEPALDGSSYRVRRGDSLSTIARRLAAGSNASTQQMMVGLYQNNAGAFEGDMNRLRAGAVLAVPSADELSAIAPAVANAEVRRQTGSWRPSTTSGDAPGRLRLVAPSESPAAGGVASGDSAETETLRSRVRELEGQLSESQRVLELRNAELADLQAKLAAAQGGTAPTPTPTPVEPPVAATPTETPPATGPMTPTTEVPATDPTAAAPTTEPPVAATPTETPPATEPVTPPAVEPTPAAEAPVASTSFVDTLLNNWYLIALPLLALLGFLGFKKFQSRKSAEFDDRLGQLAERGDAMEHPVGESGRYRQPTIETERIVVEETGAHAPLTSAPPVETARVASDDTISSDTAINLDQGDPLAEADFHMAYGLYDQAADLVRIAIAREPERRDLKLKLLEVFFVWGNRDQFLNSARELADSKSAGAAGEWEKILIMGKQIAPEDPLFANASVPAGGAMGVDLNLDGGTARVDFDPFDGAAGTQSNESVDLDLGGALRDPDATGESLAMTGLNTASIDQGGATTREMTAKVMAAGVAAAAFEGSEAPTVEQPALRGFDNPTIREKVEGALRRQPATDQTAELAIDDLGLDLGSLDNTDAPGLDDDLGTATDGNAPTMVAGLDDNSRRMMAAAAERAAAQQAQTGTKGASGTWFLSDRDMGGDIDPTKDSSATASLQALPDTDFDAAATSRLKSLDTKSVDFELTKTGAHNGLDLDVGAAPPVAGGGTQKTEQLRPEDLALPDLEPVTLSEVGTKLDLARAYVDMGDPDGARNILQEVLNEGSVSQKQEAQRLLESLPG